jgi:predicted phage terminase large subunit-like protein
MESEALDLARQKVEERARAKRDVFFLANDVLGFDFVPNVHAELFACYPKFDESKAWADQSELKDILVLWARGHYKTSAVIVKIIQAIINFPNIRILLMQGSIKVTKTLLKQIVTHFTGEAEGSRFKDLFPEMCGTKTELNASAMEFTTPARTRKQLAQATVTVASPRSIKTGQHYEIGVFDDLVNDQNYRNQTLMEKVREDFTLAQALIDPGGLRWCSGTRYAFGDLWEQILRWQASSGKWTVTVKTCWTDSSDGLPYAEKTPRFPRYTKKNGELGGFTQEQLLQMQTDDPANFACQYLNCPIHSSQQAYTKELLMGAVVIPADLPALSQPIMVCDLASTEAIHSDDSVIQIGRVDTMGTAYLCDQRGDQWAPMELAMNIIDMALRYRPVKILFEKTASCIYFADFLRLIAKQKGVYLPLDSIKVDNRDDAKNMRVVALAGVIKRGKFKIFAGLPKFDALVEQACEFPKGRHKHDDYIDTAALLYQQLSRELMALPVRTAPKNPILAIMSDRENALVKVLTEQERNEVEAPDQTGLD